MSSQIYEFENFLPEDICDTIVLWFSTRPKNSVNGLFNGKTIGYADIQDYAIKRWMNAAKIDAIAKAKEVFSEDVLYNDYSALVEWGSGSGMVLHSDNCYDDGGPNLVNWRKYSGVLYLNDNFGGGETLFPDHGPYFAKPAKGKLVLYPAGLEYRHAITTVVGTRYVMPMWFTTDRNLVEV